MKGSVVEKRKLIAEFLSDIGVAWFAAGVIGVFVGQSNNIFDIIKSLVWGIGFSLIFLFLATDIIEKGKRK